MKRAFPALLALLCATLALLIATSSSPLYAANFWTDTNIYFTIGRGMTRGLMPYRDLFDHKGPLLFMLYALGAAISDTSFIGVFILEALSLAAAVYAGWRTVSLFGEGRLTLLSMPILAAVVCCCTAFTQGGSAEEFALPALAAGVYLALALNQPWYVCVIGAMLAGAMLGAISGALKSYCNVNEVISCIMLNWISLYVVNMILTTVKETTSPYTVTISSTNPAALIPSLGLGKLFSNNQYVTIALPIALLVSILIWVVLEKTKFGYELRATGNNKNAAKYCGMNEKRNIILTMVIAGALAGLGAALLFLTGFEQWQCSQSSVPGMGFNGIAAAFLGGLNPIGNIFSSYFIQHITNGGAYVDKTMYCAQISDLISAIIIYLCGFVAFFKYFINNCIDRSEERKAHKKAAEDAAEKAGAIKEGGNK